MNEVMSLDGGLLDNGERYNYGNAPVGRKVKYLNKNGMLGNRMVANKLLKEGQVLEVEEIYVGGSHSEVVFVSLPNESFNTVMFEDVE